MHFLLPFLILAAEAGASIDPGGEEAVEVFRCDFARQFQDGAASDVDVNYDAWPDGWKRQRGPEFPDYVKIGLESSERDDRWLQVNLDGGAVAVHSPSLEISPQYTYLVEGRLRTDGLQFNEAYYSLTFYDAEDRFLERYESPRLRSASVWRTLQIGPLTPHSGQVRKAVIGLHVAPTDRADLHGQVRFDDVRLARLPRMTLTANRPHHVYADPQAIVIACEAWGMREPNPDLELRVLDLDGAVVDSETRRMAGEPSERIPSASSPGTQTYAASVEWTPHLEEPGFYRVQATINAHGRIGRRRTLTLAVVRTQARHGALAHGGAFGWSLPHDGEPLPLEGLASLSGLAGVQWVKIPAWFDPKDQIRAERLARFVERVGQEGITVVGVLDRPPADAIPLFQDEQALHIASVFLEKDGWQTTVDPVMTRLTPIIRWWQLGDDYDASFVGFPNLAEKIEEVRQRLGRFGQKVNVGLAWQWLVSGPDASAKSPPWQFLNLALDPADPPFTAAEVTRYLERQSAKSEERWVALQPLPREQYDLNTRARDLVERMVAVKIGGADVAFVPRPFDAASGLMNPDGTPSELFPVWRTAALLLAGTEYLGSIEMPGGSQNHVFARGEESVMVLWNDRPTQETLYLGEEVRQIDLWDRQKAPSRNEEQHTIEAGPLPTFVAGVNTAVARWRLEFQFLDSRLASVFGRPQLLEYHFKNSFPQGVSGRLAFHAPGVWDVERERLLLKLSAGESGTDVVRVALRPTASSGLQQVRVDFEITSDREYRFSVWRTIEVGLQDVAMELSTRLDEEGRLVVEQQLINRSDQAVNFLCQLFAPGRPRIRRPALNLNHGRTTITYYLPNGAELLGQTLILRAEEINGDRALNYRFEAK